MDQSKTCGNCVHWQKKESVDYGVCKLINSWHTETAHGHIETLARFGCNGFERKPIDYKEIAHQQQKLIDEMLITLRRTETYLLHHCNDDVTSLLRSDITQNYERWAETRDMCVWESDDQ